MSDRLRTFAATCFLRQTGALLMMEIGTRFGSNRHLIRLGEIAHRQKLRASNPFGRSHEKREGRLGAANRARESAYSGRP